jgi:DNA primase
MINKNNLSFLGKFRENRDELIFKTCPFCENSKSNFQINLEKNVYNCWVCSASGRLTTLLKKNGIEIDERRWQSSNTTKEIIPEKLDFSGFTLIDYEKHRKFLSSRGIDPEDVSRYNLFSTDYGRYKNKLIIPLMEGNNVVYFVSRDMFAKGRYNNPVINKKEHLLYYMGNENKMSLYIVEGAFDAISVNKLGFSVAMLLGSSISTEQLTKIRRIGFKEVIICLDGDLKKKATALCSKIRDLGFKSKIILFPGNEDPNDLYVADKEYLKKILEQPKDLDLTDEMELLFKK